MAKSIFDQFDEQMDTKALAEDVRESEKNGLKTYKNVPFGEYEVEINKMELTTTKNKKSMMVSIWFKVVSGDQKGGMIFCNQVVMQSFQIHIADDLFRVICTHLPEINIHFENYNQYRDLIMDIFEAVDGKFEFALDYSENSKGYPKFEIRDVFVLE